jgi:hypothetical protein
MTEQEWLASNDPQKMLAWLRGRASSRKLRLFACACCGCIQDLFEDQRSLTAIEVAEKFADGLANASELTEARRAAEAALHGEVGSAAVMVTRADAWSAARCAALAVEQILKEPTTLADILERRVDDPDEGTFESCVDAAFSDQEGDWDDLHLDDLINKTALEAWEAAMNAAFPEEGKTNDRKAGKKAGLRVWKKAKSSFEDEIEGLCYGLGRSYSDSWGAKDDGESMCWAAANAWAEMWTEAWDKAVDECRCRLPNILRDVIGNPLCPVTLHPPWRDASMIDLARRIDQERDIRSHAGVGCCS